MVYPRGVCSIAHAIYFEWLTALDKINQWSLQMTQPPDILTESAQSHGQERGFTMVFKSGKKLNKEMKKKKIFRKISLIHHTSLLMHPIKAQYQHTRTATTDWNGNTNMHYVTANLYKQKLLYKETKVF